MYYFLFKSFTDLFHFTFYTSRNCWYFARKLENRLLTTRYQTLHIKTKDTVWKGLVLK